MYAISKKYTVFFIKVVKIYLKSLAHKVKVCYNLPMPLKTKLLGVDFGLRRVGVAQSDELGLLATPLSVINTKSMRETIDKISALAAEHNVGGIVVGLPLELDGKEGSSANRVRSFGKVLAKVTGLPVEYIDERLTTVEAYELLAQSKTRKDYASIVDSVSAQIILQTYLNSKK